MSQPTVNEQRSTTSFSEINTWSTCRKKWSWSYSHNIEPRGVRRAPALGSCGHFAIAASLRGEDWNAAVDEWVKKELSKQDYFDEEIEEFNKVASDVKAILPRYFAHYKPLEAIAVEQEFEIPLKGSRTKLEGIWDALVKDDQGNVWLMETKFPGQFRSEEQIDLDAQLGIYHYAALRHGFPVVGIIYNQISAKPLKTPELLKSGKGVSRAQVRCTWDLYRQFVIDNGFDPAEYEEEMRPKLAGVEEFRRYFRYRPLTEVRKFMDDLYNRVWDMRKAKKHIYMNDNRFNCGMCSFRELCIEELKGGDVEGIIQMSFQQRRPRKEAEAAVEAEIDLEAFRV